MYNKTRKITRSVPIFPVSATLAVISRGLSMRSDVIINKLWWEHLAPKPIIPRRREVEALLNNFIRTSPYGAEWIKVANNPNGIFRVKPGQVIPVVQLIFLGKAPGFVAPFKNRGWSSHSRSSY